MAELEPPKRSTSSGGWVLGGMAGVIVAVVLSLVGVIGVGVGLSSSSHDPGACGRGILAGAVLLAVAAGFGALAWYLLFRNRKAGFGPDFLRAMATTIAVFLLAPWPCSYTWAAFFSLAACR
jgi:hypothetical protein